MALENINEFGEFYKIVEKELHGVEIPVDRKKIIQYLNILDLESDETIVKKDYSKIAKGFVLGCQYQRDLYI